MSKLTQYKPLSAFSLFDNELNNFFNQLSNYRPGIKWIPAVDVIEAKVTGGNLSLEAGDALRVGTGSAGSGKAILKGKSLAMLSSPEGELSSLITGGEVEAEAGGSVDLDVFTNFLSLKTTDAGSVLISEIDDLVVRSAEVADGALSITAQGDLRVEDLDALGTGVIDLQTGKGSIALGNIDAGTDNKLRVNAFKSLTKWAGRVTSDITEIKAGGAAVIDLAGGELEVDLVEVGDLTVLSAGNLSIGTLLSLPYRVQHSP